jgi:L-amino acid N-acyltransferase YncA
MRIRSIQVGDAKAVRDIYAPFVSESATSFEIDPPDVAEMEQRIWALADLYPWLVFEADGEVLGYTYASRHRERLAYQWCVEVSVYVHGSMRRRGVGRALYVSLFEVLRRQGYVNAYAGITLPNPSSVRLHELLGFAPIGVFTQIGYKLGQWHDVAWLQLRLREASTPIPHPHSTRAILSNTEIAAILQRQAQTVRLE